jgi:parvulin-like peptidyl-prolyl isomerase
MTPKKRNRLFLILLAGCAAAAAAQQVVEEIVAIVNDEVITLSDYKKGYDQQVAQIKAQFQGEQQEKVLEQMKAELLDSMITIKLLLQLAKEQNLNVTDQLKMAIENIKKENSLESDDELQRALRSQGLQYDAWLKDLEERILRESVLYKEINKSLVLDEAEIIDYYKKHGAEFVVPEEYKVRAVYLAPDLRSAAETEARKAEVLDKLKGGLDFAKAAEEFCDAPLKEAKGDLGTLKKGETDKTLFEALAPLKKGERTGWVEGKKGWYLLQVEDKKDSRTRTFDEAKRDIEQKMFQERQAAKMDGFLKDLKKRNYIKILKPNPLG